MPARTPIRDRYSFANIDEALSLPDLISVQRDSFEWFLQEGLKETFRDISPIKDFTETLQLELEFDPDDEDLRPPPKFSVEECKEKDMTYSAPIFVRARFINAATGEIKEQTVFMGDFPMMTDKGTFVINGTERVVVSQLVRSPGVIFEPGERYRLRNLTKHQLVKGTVHPYRGEWIEFDVEQKPGKDVTAGTRVARKRRLSIFILMRALGYGEDRCPGFMDAFVRHFDFLEGQWEKDREIAPTREEALVEIYKRARPGEPPSVESARAYFDNAFFQNRRYDLSRVGRYKLDKKLRNEIERLGELFPMLNGADEDGLPFLDRPEEGQPVLSRCEVLAACSYLLHLVNAEPGYRLDDQDHFANRRIRSVGELIQNQVRIGLSRMERVVRERMTTQDVEAITPQTLINIRPVVAAIKEFFGTSQLSQFMDQVNPLSGLTHRRRLSALGPGGLSRERAGFEVRDVHFSHYGRMCPIETPEGPNIGLIGALSTFARVNAFGFIESPYRNVHQRQGHRRRHLAHRRRGGGLRRRPGQRAAQRQDDVQERADPRAPVAAGRHPREPAPPARARHLLRRHHGDLRGAAGRGAAHGRVAEADRLGRHRAHPVPRARRRQPRAHGRQHAEAGRPAREGGGAVHRHRRRGPGGPRRRRHDHRRGRRRRHRVLRRRHHRGVQDQGQEGLQAPQVRALEPGHVHQPEAARGRGRLASRRARSSPTAPPPTTASWRWARTCSSPSCRGRATTSRTPSSSASGW